MTVIRHARPADSPYVEAIWRAEAESSGCDIVAADTSWDMIVTRHDGDIRLTVWGPMTHAKPIPHPEGSEHLGIRFRLGTFMPRVRAASQHDTGLTLPEATDNRFWLYGGAWEYPNFDNVESFIERLVHDGLLQQDSIVKSALQGREQDVSLRSVQRRFQCITGLTHRAIRSIERAQQAVEMLKSGVSIPDAVYLAGYADQQHMTRALRQFIGKSPARIARASGAR